MVRRAVSVAAVAVVVLLVGGWLVVYSGLIGGPTPRPLVTGQRTLPPPQRTASPPVESSRDPSAKPTASVADAPTPTPFPTPIDTNVHAAAVVVPFRSADLAMSISGIVNTVYVSPNDQVIGGELLLKLDQTKYLSDIEIASASVDQTQAAADAATLIVEQLPPDATTDQIAAAQAGLKVAQTNLELAHSQLSAAQAALRQTELRAPIAGRVATIDVAPGEQVTAGDTVVTIGDTSTWLIETTDVSEIDVVRVAVGDRATISFTALPDLVATGVVDSIQGRGANDDGEISPSYVVTIRPDAYLAQLRWNMTANVSIVPST